MGFTTIVEINNDYFEVQFSEDAEEFVTIDRISGHGNSSFKRWR